MSKLYNNTVSEDLLTLCKQLQSLLQAPVKSEYLPKYQEFNPENNLRNSESSILSPPSFAIVETDFVADFSRLHQATNTKCLKAATKWHKYSHKAMQAIWTQVGSYISKGLNKSWIQKNPAGALLQPAGLVSLQQILDLCEVLDSTNHLRSVGVLVVVPRDNLNLVGLLIELENESLGSIEE